MDHVGDLLKDKGVYYTISGRDYLIRCLNPEHDDFSPSCRVDRVTGITHCFSCGFKTNIFKYYGVLTNQVFLKVAKLKEKLKQLKIDKYGIEYPSQWVPYSHSFRGISVETLKKFGAFYITVPDSGMEGFEDRIIFPIRDITGNIVMFLGRHALSNGNPRYLNYPSGVKIPLYPSKLEDRHKSIVLVEGIFDMLNLQDKGLNNSVCTFGTSTLLKNTREKLLAFKTQGIIKIYIMFDGDKAGRDAAKELKPLIEEAEFDVEIINLEDDSDPGDLSQEYVDSIKEYINAV